MREISRDLSSRVGCGVALAWPFIRFCVWGVIIGATAVFEVAVSATHFPRTFTSTAAPQNLKHVREIAEAVYLL